MNSETSFACMSVDHGIASELLHVSPVFVRCGPPRRGRFDDQRYARTLRSDARHEGRGRRTELDSNVAVTPAVLFR